MAKLEVGEVVGGHRWPYNHVHPDCWGRPHVGVVLADDDPRAWEGTLAFPFRRPSAWEAWAHVAWCRSWGGLAGDSVPVLWLWGDGAFCVYWESVGGDYGVKPYADDLAAWEAALAAARAQEVECRRRWRAREVVREAHRRREGRALWRSGRIAA